MPSDTTKPSNTSLHHEIIGNVIDTATSGVQLDGVGNVLVATVSSLSSGPVNWNSGNFGNTVGVNFTIGNPFNFNNSSTDQYDPSTGKFNRSTNVLVDPLNEDGGAAQVDLLAEYSAFNGRGASEGFAARMRVKGAIARRCLS